MLARLLAVAVIGWLIPTIASACELHLLEAVSGNRIMLDDGKIIDLKPAGGAPWRVGDEVLVCRGFDGRETFVNRTVQTRNRDLDAAFLPWLLSR